MPSSFDYAVIRLVPRAEREEFVNVGVILICRERAFLGARVALDKERIHTIAPALDLEEIERQLALIPLVCSGDPAGGEIAELPISERFQWLAAARSTPIQNSSVHSGLTEDPQEALDRLLETMVRMPPKEAGPAAT
ncbi:MAG: DUF3037 domain-containing protein [Chloroflexi bacterium]|nr:DUF3037 domain-containing protein [Chloroflexota bacterium]